MDWSGVVIAVVSAIGSGGTVSAIYTANKSAEVGLAANEIEATKVQYAILETHSKELRELWQEERERSDAQARQFQEQLDELNAKLDLTRARISTMERREVYATRYIEKLKDHIWQKLPPPPPEPDRELDYRTPTES